MNELVDRPISLVILGHSNIARAILVNELIGGKPLFPVVSLKNAIVVNLNIILYISFPDI